MAKKRNVSERSSKRRDDSERTFISPKTSSSTVTQKSVTQKTQKAKFALPASCEETQPDNRPRSRSKSERLVKRKPSSGSLDSYEREKSWSVKEKSKGKRKSATLRPRKQAQSSKSPSPSSGLRPSPQKLEVTSPRTAVSRLLAKEKDIEDQCWYHGLTSREDAESQLVKSGDFIVRATEHDGSPCIVISLFVVTRKHHLTIAVSPKGQFYLTAVRKGRHFKTICDLIKHYKKNSIKLKDGKGKSVYCRLKEGVPRPKWLVKSENIAFDPNAKPLGSGNFSNVYIGTFTCGSGKNLEAIPVAIKVLKEKIGSSDEKQAKQAMIREGKVMSFYSHPNVVQFYGLACDRPQQIILVMEYCPGGSLENHLRTNGAHVVNAERVNFAYEAALGMRYLHGQGCLHRDLAARNCLISSEGIIKISDFGLSTADGIAEQRMTNMPLRWMSPETLVKKPSFSPKSDVWAFGILLFEIFNDGEAPWSDDPYKLIASNIRKLILPKMPARTPPPIVEIVQSIWVKETRRRPSFCAIVARLKRIRCGDLKPVAVSQSSLNRLPTVHLVDKQEAIEERTEMTLHYSKTTAVCTDDKTSANPSEGKTSADSSSCEKTTQAFSPVSLIEEGPSSPLEWGEARTVAAPESVATMNRRRKETKERSGKETKERSGKETKERSGKDKGNNEGARSTPRKK